MNTPPPIPSDKPPFAKQAARFSAFTPLAALVVNMVGNGVAQGNRTMATIFSILGGLLIVAGIVLGIIALFGVRRHGRKGILGFAITGIAINTFLVVAAVLTFQSVRARSEQIRQMQLQQQQQQQQNP
jgi:multisubunit Na+/H+ antiporter MnhC subunit